MSRRKETLLSRGLAAALMIVLLFSMCAFGVSAENDAAAVTAPAGKVLIQEVSYNIVPGVTETDVFFNSSGGSAQSSGFLTTISPSANVTFKASYTGYYTKDSSLESRKSYAESIASDWKWGLETVPDQAAAYEEAIGGNVVAATNGDYYNMQTAQPLGCLVMEGNVVQKANEPYFAVLKDGSYAIRDAYTDCSDVLEAVSGPFYIVNNGEITENATNNKLNPVNSIGLKADGTVVMFQVDGRQNPYSAGMTLYELADFLKSQGVVKALYLDGGGSATYASKREGETALQVRGRPSDGVVRTVSSALLVVSNETNDSIFDHARIDPAGGIYEKGSTVQFSAVGVSASGAPAQMPAAYEWTVADEACGSVDANGCFKADPNFEGTVSIQIVSDGKQIGQASIEIADIGKLCFTNEDTKLDLSQFGAGWIELGNDVYHFDETGHAHGKASVSDTRTCTQYGQLMYTCPDCGGTYGANAIWPEGHEWDENHVCVKCGTKGKDISTCTVTTGTAEFNGNTALTWVNMYDGDTKLTIKSSEVSADGYILYSHYKSVGYGQVTIKGCGNYYGTISKAYKIVPGRINELNVDNVTKNSITLTWNAAPGATDYRIEYKTGDGSWKAVLTTNNTEKTRITIGGLEPNTKYSFRAYGFAKLDSGYFNATQYSPVTTVTTEHEHVFMDGVCTICGHTHSYTGEVTAPSCTEKGYTTYKCNCGSNYVGNDVAALGHTEVVDEAVAATCTKTGLTEGKHCSVCDTILTAQETVPMAAHEYKDGVCTACGAKDPDHVPPHTHSYTTAVTAPTCTEKGYTTHTCACGDSYKDSYVDAKGHTEVTDAAVAATCTKTGLTEGKHCSVCNEVLVKQETVPMSEHKFENGVCTVCGAKAPAVNPFKDVEESSTYAEAIGWAYANGITKGKTADIFGVNENCTRAQAVTLLWRSAGCPTPTTKSCTFTDVKEGSFYYEAVLWAVENKITLGKTETTFDPNGTATRAQVLTFLYRLAGEPKVENVINEFEDVNENGFYYNAVLWAVSEGITKGTDAKHFAPSAICSRAQIVTFIFRYDNAVLAK